jgi:hypothetical protein
MPTSPDKFDPLAVVVDWLDACRLGDLDVLLNLYDERATLECDSEQVSLIGRKAIAAYWAPKLESKLGSAFTLDDMILTGAGVKVDYQSYDGKSVQIHFQFSPPGKILHTSCGPLGRCAAAWRPTTLTTYTQKIAFGQMRASGVRDVDIHCRDHRCSHHVQPNADSRGDDVGSPTSKPIHLHTL